MLHTRRVKHDRLPFQLHLGPVPDTISPGEVEALHLIFALGNDLGIGKTRGALVSPVGVEGGRANHQATFGMVELHNEPVASDFVVLKGRAVGHEFLLSVLVLERVQGESLPGHGFTGVMNAAGDVDLASHSSVGNVAGQPGAEPHINDSADTRAVVPLPFLSGAIELVEIHGQLRLTPHQTPASDEVVQVVVVRQPLTHIGVALVPDTSADGEGDDGIKPSIEQPGCVAVAA